jgi:hypothetical protein
LADMVMDAIQHGAAAPTTTPVPAPHQRKVSVTVCSSVAAATLLAA